MITRIVRAGATWAVAGMFLAGAARGEPDAPAPVNPCNGMQDREEVYEFAQKPQVKKEGQTPHGSDHLGRQGHGNRLARLGRYGNTDDTDEDVKAGRDGLRFAWARAVAVSDTALYVTDEGNRRILKAALSYAAEETVGL